MIFTAIPEYYYSDYNYRAITVLPLRSCNSGTGLARVLRSQYHYCSCAAQPHTTAAIFLQTTTEALPFEGGATLLEYCSRGLLLLHFYSATTRANAR
eukprot:538261-Pyramimonas_sp.AAC.1